MVTGGAGGGGGGEVGGGRVGPLLKGVGLKPDVLRCCVYCNDTAPCWELALSGLRGWLGSLLRSSLKEMWELVGWQQGALGCGCSGGDSGLEGVGGGEVSGDRGSRFGMAVVVTAGPWLIFQVMVVSRGPVGARSDP